MSDALGHSGTWGTLQGCCHLKDTRTLLWWHLGDTLLTGDTGGTGTLETLRVVAPEGHFIDIALQWWHFGTRWHLGDTWDRVTLQWWNSGDIEDMVGVAAPWGHFVNIGAIWGWYLWDTAGGTLGTFQGHDDIWVWHLGDKVTPEGGGTSGTLRQGGTTGTLGGHDDIWGTLGTC